jgi:hypothetical protein
LQYPTPLPNAKHLGCGVGGAHVVGGWCGDGVGYWVGLDYYDHGNLTHQHGNPNDQRACFHQVTGR